MKIDKLNLDGKKNPIEISDKIIAAKTSRIGFADGYPKFHKITPINQII